MVLTKIRSRSNGFSKFLRRCHFANQTGFLGMNDYQNFNSHLFTDFKSLQKNNNKKVDRFGPSGNLNTSKYISQIV